MGFADSDAATASELYDTVEDALQFMFLEPEKKQQLLQQLEQLVSR